MHHRADNQTKADIRKFVHIVELLDSRRFKVLSIISTDPMRVACGECVAFHRPVSWLKDEPRCNLFPGA